MKNETQLIQWLPVIANANKFQIMSQYGHHPQYQPSKQWGDMVDPLNANNANRFSGFPNGYPLNEAGAAGSMNGGSNSLDHQNVRMLNQQHSPQQYWPGIRLPTAALPNAHGYPQPWTNQHQQQMHADLNIVTSQMKSRTSTSVPSHATNWPKLPQQGMSIIDTNSASSRTGYHQHSPNYDQPFSSSPFSQHPPSDRNNFSQPKPYNGPVVSVVNAESPLSPRLPQNQMSPNYGHQPFAQPPTQMSPLCHSNLERFPLKTVSGFPPQVSSNTFQIPRNGPVHYHSPTDGISGGTNIRNIDLNSPFNQSCQLQVTQPDGTIKPKGSPNFNTCKSNDVPQLVQNDNDEVKKMMLTSGHCHSDVDATDQISPSANTSGSTKQMSPDNRVETEQVDISDNLDLENCPKDISPSLTPLPNMENNSHGMENEMDPVHVPSSMTESGESVMERSHEDCIAEDMEGNNHEQSGSPLGLNGHNDNNLASTNEEHKQPPAAVEKNRQTFLESSLDTPITSKDSSPESISTPSPLLPRSFSGGLMCPTTVAPYQSPVRPSASLLSGPQNLPMGPIGAVSQDIQEMSTLKGNVYTCNICRFSSTSKFHFNSHMNTHTDHKCKYCDYRSRTVGRLKRHMNDFHTHDDPLDNPSNVNQESQDSSGRMSQPPSPDDSLAVIDQQVESVVSSIAEQNQQTGTGSTKPSGSHKAKTYRCKQCSYLAISKQEFWDHQRAHIKGDRVLSCHRCSFVTEYKHHLEYHLRNHYGSKPFKCAKCNYSCVNKSMLNSHMKSHSNFYQFRCLDCTYATKYCHSLKLHLRKYGHTPATVMNPDGTPAESAILDEFGNRRQSKIKKTNGCGSLTPPAMPTQPITSLLPAMTSTSLPTMPSRSLAPFVDFLKQQQQLAKMVSIATIGAQLPTVPGSSLKHDDDMYPPTQILKCKFCNFHTTDGNEALFAHMVKHMYGLTEMAAGASGSVGSDSSASGDLVGNSMQMDDNNEYCSMVRYERQRRSGDYFSSTDRMSPSQELSQDTNSPASTSGGKISGDETTTNIDQMVLGTSKRKGKAFNVDRIALRLQGRVSPTTPICLTEKPAESSPSMVDDGIKRSGNRNKFSSSGKISSRSSDYSEAHNNFRISKAQSETRILNHQGSSISLGNRPNTTQGGLSGNATIGNNSEEHHANHSAQPINIDWSNAYVCNYCEIAFKDCIMYTIHMGYHGYQEPFKCNMCGHVNDGRLAMFLHIARAPHL